MERNGGWILTASGRQFWPLDARPEDVSLFDIAHALAKICRFGGHCRQFYSVAQHSIIVAQNFPGHKALALLHDATEAYLGDMVRPLKLCLPQFATAEDRLWEVIATRFDLPLTNPRDVPRLKEADDRTLMTERRDIMPASPHPWSTHHSPPYPEPIIPWTTPAFAAEYFLSRAAAYGIS
jgi:hypothetical protein